MHRATRLILLAVLVLTLTMSISALGAPARGDGRGASHRERGGGARGGGEAGGASHRERGNGASHRERGGGARGGGEAGGGDRGGGARGGGEGGASHRERADGEAGASHREREAGRPDAYTIPGAAVFPEGIALDRRSGDLYVSSKTDGTIFKGNVRQATLAPFAPPGANGRTTATGMQIDGRGRLFVAGAETGKAFVLSTRDASTIKVLDSNPGTSPTFVNDVALAPGYAYFTDSMRPVILRVATRGSTIGQLEPWLDLTGTPFAYADGFNANGIASFDGGAVLVVVQSNTGKLFWIDTRTRDVGAIDLGGAALTGGDGLLAQGDRLFVARNGGQIVEVRLSRDRRAGRIARTITSGALMFPTTMVRDHERLLVVNAQFDKRGGTPVLPFTLAAVALP